MPKYSKKAQQVISKKMHVMKGEKKPQAQKVAIALSEARQKGMKVPPEKANPYGGHDIPKTMEKQGKEMAIVPKVGEPFHHLPKELKQRKQDFLYHPQMASQKPRIK